MNKYILKVDCLDEAGLIYKLSEIIFKHDMNIEKNSEFVEQNENRFFFRAMISGKIDVGVFKEKIKNILPKNANLQLLERRKKNIVLFATKESHCLGDILIRYQSGELDANILAVISNHNTLEDLTSKFNIPYHYIPAKDITRQEHEKKTMQCLASMEFDLIVLAKYMRILTSDFVETYDGKIINIHHSFLPAFIGANPYKQAHDRGVKIIGATAHYVNNNLDEGPIIAQDVVAVNHEYSWTDMQKAGKNIEKTTLSKALDLVLEDRIFVHQNKTIIF